jgi:hypothetical protein
MLNAKRYAPMNARDKMPFEVTPIFYKLQRYDAARIDQSAAPAAAAPAPSPAAGDPLAAPPAAPPTAQPTASGAAQPLTGTSNPPQQ